MNCSGLPGKKRDEKKRYLINISMNRLVALFLEVGYT